MRFVFGTSAHAGAPESISLWDTAFGVNTERFQGLVPLLPHLCPLSVPKGGGDVGYIRKALQKGYLELPGSACCTDDMFEIFVRFGWRVCCLLPLFCQQAATMSVYKFTQRAVASPDAPQKPLVRKRARSGGAEWVRVTRRPAKPAQKPRAVGSQHTRFCPPQRPLLLQPGFGIVKCTPTRLLSMNFWQPASTWIWSKM